ncbi:SRPBCC domain-containing protein [Streptomyces sp. DSM 44915]|uniref:SRPBCC domain-containing protein n=1 Tax=Streptomyces chisholmiae TaxID=3075540 RepID=A0ABU2K0K7_9ACTN|nr:SRPBCC domain-containing protein [Streptomyces sp. DSM 44915]MDT0270752.1 SRPBCC domain-containing protein [Streptomyces sp. DSM 44915]
MTDDNPRLIEVDQFLPHPPERVWRALTEPELLARWLMPTTFRLAEGHPFTFTTAPDPGGRFDGVIHCRVLDFEAPSRLRISWRADGLDSTVTWRLTPEGTGTRLFLTHDGFAPDDPAQQLIRGMLGGGWRSRVLPALADLLARRPAGDP